MIESSLYNENTCSDLKYKLNEPAIIGKKGLLLAVINPHSGSGKAIKIFKTIVEPEWKKQGASYQVLITEYPSHSTELISQDKSIDRFTGIIAIGGDGTLAEINRGLEKNNVLINTSKCPKVGIIPVGSGNGLYKSLKPDTPYKSRILEAAKMTASSVYKSMDLMEVTQNNEKRSAFLAVTLGIIADSDILSEPFRCLGDFRFTLGALWCLWKNKSYQVDLSYLQDEFEEKGSKKWSKMSGKFTHLMISNTSHCSSNAHTAPGAKIDDGFLHVTAVKTVSTWTRLRLLLGLDSGNWVKHPSVISFQTRAMRINTLSSDTILTLDGERIAAQPLECCINHAALKILT